MNQQQWMEQLEKEGFSNLMVPTLPADTDMGVHTHDEHTVHVILHGELVLTEAGEVQVLKEGDKFEIIAGTTHSAKTGPEGCTMIVGVKK